MVQPGFGGLDTPQTVVGDATYLSRQPDFDMTQEPSFQSPSKDQNVIHQLRNGGRPNLRTPRGASRGILADRRNLPGLGGPEFTPLLKSATRNGSRRHSGKENGVSTPGFLGRIDEDMTPVPAGETSVYGTSRNASYVDATPLPHVDSSSVASTPMIMGTRGGGDANGNGGGVLQDGNQLSLREQENVIDRIEKENFGLKLKIHFLEEALRKAGPGFSEAALKENTDLKVDKVTMQRELQRYKKHLTSAERELESSRQQILEIQEKAKKRYADEGQRVEMERLLRVLEDKEVEVEELQHQINDGHRDQDQIEKLQDEIGDLEADVREKDRLISEREEELDDLRSRVQDAEDKMKDAQRHAVELEEKAKSSDELDDAKETIEDLEADVRQLENQLDDMKERLGHAVSEKDRAEADLQELQEEMADKSIVTKGLSRQVEEKAVRLQAEVEQARGDYSALAKQHDLKQQEVNELMVKLRESRLELDSAQRDRQSLATELDELQAELYAKNDEKALLQTRHDALTSESASLQRDVAKLDKEVAQLQDNLEQERQHALEIEKDIRSQYKDEMDRLNDEISDLQAEVREKENLYDNDSEKWENERHTLESERDRAEERAAGLQRTIDKLRETEGALSSKESQLQDLLDSEAERHKNEAASLSRRIEDLQQDLQSRQAMLEDLRNEVSAVRDELRQSQLDQKALTEKIEGLEDENELLQVTLEEESEKANQDIEATRRECDDLKKQIKVLEELASSARAATPISHRSPRPSPESVERLKSQLAESTTSLTKVTREKQALQDNLANINLELHSLRSSLAEVKAERDEMDGELRRTRQHEQDTFRLDQEKIDLRAAKTKLDGEVRRLREDNRTLMEERLATEKALEDEIEKAAAEEDRLDQEIRLLQAKIRQSTDNQELANARRTIRELERRIQDYENRITVDLPLINNLEGNSELSMMRRDLSEARQKEREYLQRESSQEETVKNLKRQVVDLERRTHEAEISRLIASPGSGSGSAQKSEITELRSQLSTAHRTIQELKKVQRDADRKATAATRELEARLEEIEEQRLALEQALEDAQQAADEAASSHEANAKRYRQKAERYKRERDAATAALEEGLHQEDNQTGQTDMSREERRDLHAMLRQTQTDAQALEREAREHREALEELMGIEAALRKKLERARIERAAYRANAEKLQRDVTRLRVQRQEAEQAAPATAGSAAAISGANGDGDRHTGGVVDTDAIVRAAEAAEQRHTKELRGMCMQIEWMQARWEREYQLRIDAAYAKRFLLLQLDLHDTCNKAQLRELEGILKILGKNKPSVLPTSPAQKQYQQQFIWSPAAPPRQRIVSGSSSSTANGDDALQQQQQQQQQQPLRKPFTLRRLAIAARFIVRCQVAARSWSAHERTRQRLAEAVRENRRAERIGRMRSEYRAAQVQQA